MSAVFNKLGICFQYPENWTLDEADAQAGRDSVSVYSPGGAFWSVTIHPPGESPERLIQAVLKIMRKEYAQVEVDSVTETLVGQELVGCDLNFYYVDLLGAAWVRVLSIDDATMVILCQAEDREFDQLQDVFRAITITLIRGGK